MPNAGRFRLANHSAFASRVMRSVSVTRAAAERQTMSTVFSPPIVPTTSGHPSESTASAIGCAPPGKRMKDDQLPDPIYFREPLR